MLQGVTLLIKFLPYKHRVGPTHGFSKLSLEDGHASNACNPILGGGVLLWFSALPGQAGYLTLCASDSARDPV